MCIPPGVAYLYLEEQWSRESLAVGEKAASGNSGGTEPEFKDGIPGLYVLDCLGSALVRGQMRSSSSLR
jgi:hypothetical protein